MRALVITLAPALHLGRGLARELHVQDWGDRGHLGAAALPRLVSEVLGQTFEELRARALLQHVLDVGREALPLGVVGQEPVEGGAEDRAPNATLEVLRVTLLRCWKLAVSAGIHDARYYKVETSPQKRHERCAEAADPVEHAVHLTLLLHGPDPCEDHAEHHLGRKADDRVADPLGVYVDRLEEREEVDYAVDGEGHSEQQSGADVETATQCICRALPEKLHDPTQHAASGPTVHEEGAQHEHTLQFWALHEQREPSRDDVRLREQNWRQDLLKRAAQRALST
mmetsp:Transcript_14463/g.50820  ORF Transcript_14463/g.50820 Transcript_14463/m.50820 type:complete len:283 (+) Transcript_14463:1228-2076(+)